LINRYLFIWFWLHRYCCINIHIIIYQDITCFNISNIINIFSSEILYYFYIIISQILLVCISIFTFWFVNCRKNWIYESNIMKIQILILIYESQHEIVCNIIKKKFHEIIYCYNIDFLFIYNIKNECIMKKASLYYIQSWLNLFLRIYSITLK
jgi:hypothetical protein